MDDLDSKRVAYPRVSDIISKQNESELRAIPIDVLANACIRGTKIHEYCTAYMKNLWVMDMESEYEPYFEAFKDWVKENIETVVSTGERLYDDVKRFTGEFDMIAKLKNGKTALIDIKTSSASSKSWPIQLSAYHHLCTLKGYTIDTICNVHLKKKQKNGEGKASISPSSVKAIMLEYKDIKPYWEIFSSALNCYDYFHRKGAKNVSP